MYTWIQVPKLEATYNILLDIRRACLSVMLEGKYISSVAETGIRFVRDKYPHLTEFLPKVPIRFIFCNIDSVSHRVLGSVWGLTFANQHFS